MNKNRIEPSGARQPARQGCPEGGRGGARQCRYGTTSWHNTAKSSGLPVEVNAAVVQGSIAFLPGEICLERSGQKSAEAIVAGETSRGLEDARLNCETGRLTRRRAEPIGSAQTTRRTVVTPKAGRPGDAESRRDGKHVGARRRVSARLSRGLVPRLNGTAGYGPVRPVVWDPWLALRVSHGDPIRQCAS